MLHAKTHLRIASSSSFEQNEGAKVIVGVRRTNFDRQMLVAKYFALRRADAHRFGATHSLAHSKAKASQDMD